jgi:cellulose synthase/poly-beta-1,6-N-acetylglucosamine synthase-like glycosyltransferase
VNIALDLSVVIAAYNSANTLGECLAALEKSTIRPTECIVVLDGAADDSEAVAQGYGVRVITLHERQGPAHARNVGLRLAQGNLVLFLDADVSIHSDAIPRILEHFRQDSSLDAVFGAYDDSPAATAFVSQYRNLLHCFTHRTAHPNACTFWAGCGAVRKEAFLRCGGLDERYGRPAVEDIEFGLRLHAAGGRLLLDPAIQAKHLKCWGLASMIKTDVFDRGIPWTRLILRSGQMPDDLNLRWTQRISVALSFLSVAALAFGSYKTTIGCVLALLCLNLPFLSFLWVRRGTWFVLGALPVHFLFHFYSGIAFGLGLGSHLLSTFRGSQSEATTEEVP